MWVSLIKPRLAEWDFKVNELSYSYFMLVPFARPIYILISIVVSNPSVLLPYNCGCMHIINV